ncbi:MAG: aminotransferase class I/II-fold pyridoxal phosphate-dependent enzyme [Cyanobacteria bacterium P01_F01_bin.4]
MSTWPGPVQPDHVVVMPVLNSPQNPTGGLLTAKDLDAISTLAQQYDFYVLADESDDGGWRRGFTRIVFWRLW